MKNWLKRYLNSPKEDMLVKTAGLLLLFMVYANAPLWFQLFLILIMFLILIP